MTCRYGLSPANDKTPNSPIWAISIVPELHLAAAHTGHVPAGDQRDGGRDLALVGNQPGLEPLDRLAGAPARIDGHHGEADAFGPPRAENVIGRAVAEGTAPPGTATAIGLLGA